MYEMMPYTGCIYIYTGPAKHRSAGLMGGRGSFEVVLNDEVEGREEGRGQYKVRGNYTYKTVRRRVKSLCAVKIRKSGLTVNYRNQRGEL